MNQPPVLNTPSTPGPDSADAAVKARVETATAALHQTIDKVSEPAVNSLNRLSAAAHSTVDKLASGASHVADRFADDARRVGEAPSRALDFSKSWVQDKPLEAVGAALLIGFLIGRLTSR